MHLNDSVDYNLIGEVIAVVEEQCATESLKRVTSHRFVSAMLIGPGIMH